MFAIMKGDPWVTSTVERAFDIYFGERDENNLGRLILMDGRGRPWFVNDDCWWKYTDAQCNFHGTYGWRPFFNPYFRGVDYNTWSRFFDWQVDENLRDQYSAKYGKAPPLGFLPLAVHPDWDPLENLGCFYCNSDIWNHDEEVDFPLMNMISATDWILMERNLDVARQYMPRMELQIGALDLHREHNGELLLVGPQGSQIEFSHGGWRYPASTLVYLLKVYENMAHVEKMLGNPSKAEVWSERANRLRVRIPEYLENGEWFISAYDRTMTVRMGTGIVDSSPSSYFEMDPNVNSVVLDLVDRPLKLSIVERIYSISALWENHLTLINYPERPRSEMDDDHGGFPQPGVHVNGGWWWRLAGSAINAFTQVQHPKAILFLKELLSDHDHHYTIDCYNDWGRNKDRQWLEKGSGSSKAHSIGDTGSFGMFFRGIFNLQSRWDGIDISPSLPLGIVSMETVAPIYYGGRKVFLDIEGGGTEIRAVFLNGEKYEKYDRETINLKYSDLEEVANRLKITLNNL